MFEGIKDKKVLITGANSGIGASMVKLFSEYGAIIGIHYIENERGAKTLLREVKKKTQAECFKYDLAKKHSGINLIMSFINKFGGIDVLINNAGTIGSQINFLELDEKSWEVPFTVNTRASFFLAQEAFKYMKEHEGGRIINISSISAKYGGSINSLHYGASKAALDAITIGLARFGASYDILVNSIRPGLIDTPLHKKFKNKNMKKRLKLTPLGRMGQPLDVARMALFLASESGNYITGQIFPVSGGD